MRKDLFFCVVAYDVLIDVLKNMAQSFDGPYQYGKMAGVSQGNRNP